MEIAPDQAFAADVKMRSIIQRIATGPELSKDIPLEDARDGMRLVLDQRVDGVQAAVFLIALRMKRETDDENRGVLQAILDVAGHMTADVERVVDIADPYDGYTRGLPASPFLPAVLAALGLPSVSHGVESMGPKYGITHNRVLQAAGIPVDLTPAQAAVRLAEESLGWAYIDQRSFCPALHALTELRTLIVKRPCLTTVEVLVGPIRGRQTTHLVTGYVHKAYPRVYTMLARHAGFDSAMIVRGVEGGVVPSLQQPAKIVQFYGGGDDEELRVAPQSIGIEQSVRAAPLPADLPSAAAPGDGIGAAIDIDAAAAATADAGEQALRGRPGPVRDSLVYAAALCQQHVLSCTDLRQGALRAAAVIDSGAALERWRAARQR